MYYIYHSLSFWFKLFFLLPSHKLSLSFAVQTYDIFLLIFYLSALLAHSLPTFFSNSCQIYLSLSKLIHCGQ